MRPAVSPVRWLRSEQLIALDPDPQHLSPAEWRRRLLAFPGRSLSHTLLAAEQDQRAGRLARRGQMRTAGVLDGFEVTVDHATRSTLRIAAGYGLSASGEDVSLARPIEVAVSDLLVCDVRGDGVVGATEQTFGELRGQGIVERTLVLVMAPVELSLVEGDDLGDACEGDPSRDPFVDQQRVDGALPVWVRLPPAALNSVTLDDVQRRNRLAHWIFERELTAPLAVAPASDKAAPTFPWEDVGVALALVDFDGDGNVRFVDRHAVARRGGKARPRSALLLQRPSDPALAAGYPRRPYAGAPTLWQARIDQHSEHVLDLVVANRTAPGAVYSGFAFAPPAGILPLDVFSNLSEPTRSQRFFPSTATVEWQPIPQEQLDAALAASASLARIDFSKPFVVRMLLPVPATVFDPKLLVEDLPSAALLEKRRLIVEVRREARTRRDQLAAQRLKLMQDLDTQSATTPVDPVSAVSEGATAPTAQKSIEDVDIFLAQVSGLGGQKLRDEVDAARVRGGFREVRRTLAQLADKADDAVDFGFLRVQSDIYRVRQVVLGNEKAMQLAASPALAAIVQGSTAFAGARELSDFFASVQTRQPAPSAPTATEVTDAPVAPRTVRRNPAPVAGGRAFSTTARAPLISKPTTVAVGGIGSAPTIKQTTAPFASRVVATGRPPVAIDGDLRDEVSSLHEFETPAVDRTVSIAERLEDAPSTQSLAGARATKYSTLNALAALPGALDLDALSIPVPGKKTVATVRTLGNVKGNLANLSAKESVVDSALGLKSAISDEARAVSGATRMLDETVNVLRQVAARVANLRRLITLADALIATLQKALDDVATQLATAEKALAEARHDLSVADALVAEDAREVADTNARRRNVIASHVRFVAFVRPRTIEAIDSAPSRDLESPDELPVPSCFRENLGEIPPEIRQAVDLVRRAPIAWLPTFHPLLDALNDRATLGHIVRSAAALASFTMTAKSVSRVKAEARPLARGLEAGFAAMEAQLSERDETLRGFDEREVDALSWTELRTRSLDVVSVADFAHVAHLRPDVLQRAGQGLDGLTRVATCLYRRFAEVPPEVRLDWAQKLSVFDTAVGLRDLLALPRFSSLPIDDRAAMQSLVDWLFSQVAPLPRPRAMIDNLIRVCVLLASHAPVRALLRGTISRVTVSVGHVLRISAVDIASARIGMNALIKLPPTAAGKEPFVRAVVEDISDEHVSARVFAASDPSVELPDDTEAFLGDPEHITASVTRVLGAAKR